MVGGGNTALEEALFLSNICKSVAVLVRRDKVKADRLLFEAAKAKSNIAFKYNTVLTEICGEKGSVSSLNIVNKVSSEESKLNVAAVFIAVGLAPNNSIFSDFIKLDKSGYIIADETCLTNVPGVFVAGDTRTKALRQIITAASDGAVAAKNVVRYLN